MKRLSKVLLCTCWPCQNDILARYLQILGLYLLGLLVSPAGQFRKVMGDSDKPDWASMLKRSKELSAKMKELTDRVPKPKTMSTKKIYSKLPKYCKEMTREELLQFFPEGTTTEIIKTGPNKGQEHEVPLYTQAFMMRTLIMNELEYCDKEETRTLRGVWYSAIKPTLDKLGLLEEKDSSEEELKRWDATLSNYVCDLLRRGKLTFSDLGIKDISRQKFNPSESFYNVPGNTYSFKGNVTPYPNILIATEKDTVYEIISTIAELYGCSAISCKGQNSLGAMESIVKGMFTQFSEGSEKRGKKNYPMFSTIYILTMTDYDPAGYYIAEALVKQVQDILSAIGKTSISVETHRIGITPDQLTKEEVLQNMYSPKKANIKKWMGRTGGIDGQEKGLELDAFSTRQIREIFVSNLKKFINGKLYRDFVKSSYIKRRVLEAAKDRVEAVVKLAIEQVAEEVETVDFDIHEFAVDGQKMLYISDLCTDNMDERIFEIVDENL